MKMVDKDQMGESINILKPCSVFREYLHHPSRAVCEDALNRRIRRISEW